MTYLFKNKFLFVLLCLLIAMANVLLDHFFAPIGIFLMPIVVILLTALINSASDRFNIWIQVILVYTMIAINDIGIKLYGGGVHDWEGQGFVTLFLFAGLIPAFFISLIFIFKSNSTFYKKVLSVSLFLLLVGLHLYLFGNLGIGRSYKIYHL